MTSVSQYQPERTCVGCRKKFQQKDLLSVKRLKDNAVIFDPDQRFFGRSVYICNKKECFLKAFQRKGKNAFEPGLKVKIPENIFEEMKKFFECGG